MKFLMAAVLIPLLSGCYGSPYMKGRPQVVAEPDKVSAMLADAADRASTSLEKLAAIESQSRKVPSTPNLNGAPPELMRGITINWVGPVEGILDTLANRASYTFKVFGKAPATPLITSVDTQQQPIIDVLKGIGIQLGSEAAVHVDAQARVVELRYVTKFQDIDDL